MEKLVHILDEPNWKLLLFDIVKSNEFNIWNLDLINLTDLYLKKIYELKKDNILIPANALLAASILLKIKAFTLKLTSIESNEEILIPSDDDLILNVLNFENPIRNKESQVSLDNLIEAIDFIMNKPTKKNLERIISEKKDLNFQLPKVTEDINIRVNSLYKSIREFADNEGCIVFNKLYSKENSNFDVVNNLFIPLLFLYQDKKINVWQDDFFSEIFIKII